MSYAAALGRLGSAWGRRHTLVLLVVLAVTIGYSDRVNISVAALAMREQLHWTQTTKGLVLSAFFVGYLGAMLASGWLAQRFGGRIVLGIAVLWWSVCTLATPWAAQVSLPMLLIARIAIGAGEAAVFPASIELIARWTPRAEHAGATTFMLSGVPLGTVVGLLGTGWLLTRWAWPSAFYVFGALGIAWAFAWFALTAASPATAPRLGAAERSLLEREAEGPAVVGEPIPWRALLSHRAVWALVAAHFALTWTLYVLLSWLPSYLRDVQGVAIGTAGIFAAAPWIANFATTHLGVAASAAIVRRTGRAALARKSLQAVALLGSAACLVLARFAPHSAAAVLAILCLGTGLLGCGWAGYGPNFLDLAPRHSPLLFAFSNTIATIPGVVGVSITGWLVDLTGTYDAAFMLAAAVSVAATLVFAVFGSSRPVVA